MLSDYLALSCPLHALDGWRYLSAALVSLLNGARTEALHLAYYAELRAALSILAGSGIAVLNNKHYAIDNTGLVYWFSGKTHSTALERDTGVVWHIVCASADPRIVLCFWSFG